MDYKELLKKYMKHVGAREGASFVESELGDRSDFFSDEEWKEIRKIDEEITKEYWGWPER